MDGNLHLVGNLATDVGQLLVKEIIVAPLQGGEVFEVGAVAEVKDDPPVGGFLAVALIVADLDNIGDGDVIFLAARTLLDGELGRFADDLTLPEAVHDSTERTEVDALGGIGQAGFIHGGFPLADEGFIDHAGRHLGFLAFDHEGFLLGIVFAWNALDGAAKKAVEVLQGGAVLETGLLGVLALAELDPILKER